MTTKVQQDVRGIPALPFLEKLAGGPLTVARSIEAIRLCDEMTQATFAARLGISKSLLVDIEKGRKLATAEQATTFARILGHAPEHFLKLALQEEVTRAGLGYTIEVHAA